MEWQLLATMMLLSNAQELPDQWNQSSNWIYVDLKKSKNKHLQSQPQMVENVSAKHPARTVIILWLWKMKSVSPKIQLLHQVLKPFT